MNRYKNNNNFSNNNERRRNSTGGGLYNKSYSQFNNNNQNRYNTSNYPIQQDRNQRQSYPSQNQNEYRYQNQNQGLNKNQRIKEEIFSLHLTKIPVDFHDVKILARIGSRFGKLMKVHLNPNSSAWLKYEKYEDILLAWKLLPKRIRSLGIEVAWLYCPERTNTKRKSHYDIDNKNSNNYNYNNNLNNNRSKNRSGSNYTPRSSPESDEKLRKERSHSPIPKEKRQRKKRNQKIIMDPLAIEKGTKEMRAITIKVVMIIEIIHNKKNAFFLS